METARVWQGSAWGAGEHFEVPVDAPVASRPDFEAALDAARLLVDLPSSGVFSP